MPKIVTLRRMEFPHFVRVERESVNGSASHFVLHTHDPKMLVELAPDTQAPDKMGQGVIKRIAVPNSWAGNYSQYAKMVAKAQAFFKASCGGESAAKDEVRRFQQ
tara:strand:+ start:550 stop:864 length:315 start_codon:yes stop_codon:yes gene_type:complete